MDDAARSPRSPARAGGAWLLAAPAWALAAVAAPAALPALPEPALRQAVAVAEALARARAPQPARVLVEPGTPDARLRLAPCDEIRAAPSPGAPAWGRTRVLLQCARGPVAWRITLPLTVQVWAPAWVLAESRQAGDTLAEGQWIAGVVDWAAAPTPPLPLHEDPAGRTLARPLAAGEPLREADLRARQWFVAGDTVQVTARGPGFAVRAEVQALTPGIEGRPARLKGDNGRILTATPVGLRQAEVRP